MNSFQSDRTALRQLPPDEIGVFRDMRLRRLSKADLDGLAPCLLYSSEGTRHDECLRRRPKVGFPASVGLDAIAKGVQEYVGFDHLVRAERVSALNWGVCHRHIMSDFGEINEEEL